MALTDTAGGAGSVARADESPVSAGPEGRAGLVARAWRLPLLAHVVLLVVGAGAPHPARPTDGARRPTRAPTASRPSSWRGPAGTTARRLPSSTRTARTSRSAEPTRSTAAGTRTSSTRSSRRRWRRLIGGFGRDAGVGVFSLAGTVAAAVAAWFLAKELDPRRCRARVLADRHEPAPGRRVHGRCPHLGGRLRRCRRVCGLRIERRGPTFAARPACSRSALCGGALVRSEGVLWAAASCWRLPGHGGAGAPGRTAVSAVAAPRPRRRRHAVARAALGGAIVHAGAPSDLVARVGSDGPGGTAGVPDGSTAPGDLALDVRGHAAGPLTVRLLLPAGLLVVTMIRRSAGGGPTVPRSRSPIAGLAALVVMLWIAHPTVLVSGFLPAAHRSSCSGWPSLWPPDGRSGPKSLLLGAAALFTARAVRDPVRRRWGLPVGRTVPDPGRRAPGGRGGRAAQWLVAASSARPGGGPWSARSRRWRSLSSLSGVAAVGTGRAGWSRSSTRRSPPRRRR